MTFTQRETWRPLAENAVRPCRLHLPSFVSAPKLNNRRRLIGESYLDAGMDRSAAVAILGISNSSSG